MGKRIIFLDFHGVITSNRTHGKLDGECVARLNWLIVLTGARIVVSSSSRTDVGDMRRKLALCGVKGRVISITPDLDDHEWDFSLTPRGEEIQAWLDKHAAAGPWEFIILDDGGDMLHLEPRLVQTDHRYGLTEEKVIEACALFGAPYFEEV